MSGQVKPKLVKVWLDFPPDHRLAPGLWCWSCASPGYGGFGKTPDEAYLRWGMCVPWSHYVNQQVERILDRISRSR